MATGGATSVTTSAAAVLLAVSTAQRVCRILACRLEAPRTKLRACLGFKPTATAPDQPWPIYYKITFKDSEVGEQAACWAVLLLLQSQLADVYDLAQGTGAAGRPETRASMGRCLSTAPLSAPYPTAARAT